MAEGLNVGDGVLTFLADTTQMDQAFEKVNTEAVGKMGAATAAVDGTTAAVGELSTEMAVGANGAVELGEVTDLAGKKMKASMYEARGEIGLVGEEIGVRLPRHVRSFIAELPGVGTALSSAFEATAVLFIIQAVVELTKKASELAGAWLYSTEANKQLLKEYSALNLELNTQVKLYKDAKEALDTFNETAAEKTAAKIEELRNQLEDHNKELVKLQNYYDQGIHNATLETNLAIQKATVKALQEQIELNEKIESQQSNDAELKSLQQEIKLREQLALAVIGFTKARFQDADQAATFEYEAKLESLKKQLKAEDDFGHDNEDKVRAINNAIKVLMEERGTALVEATKKDQDEVAKILESWKGQVEASGGVDIILPENVQSINQFRQAAASLGITLRSDLVQALNTARVAKQNFVDAAGTTDTVALKQFDLAIQTSEKNLDNYGKSMDRLKTKGETTFKGLVQDLHQGISVTHELSDVGISAFDGLSRGIESAISSAILGQKSLGAALEEATAQALAQLAAQALVKALFYSAEGFAALAGFADSSAAQYFTAAGIMGAVGGAAAVAGHALSGAGGSSPSGSSTQGSSSISNAAQQPGQGPVAVTGVQHFGGGALINRATLAVVGDRNPDKGEAILPLDDKTAMSRIGKELARHSGGGGVTVNVKGHVIGASDVAHLTGQISRRVRKGQANLQSSNTLRVTRRSA